MSSERVIREIRHRFAVAEAVSNLEEAHTKETLEKFDGIHCYEDGRLWVTQELYDKIKAEAKPAVKQRSDGIRQVLLPLGSIEVIAGKPEPKHFVASYTAAKEQTNE